MLYFSDFCVGVRLALRARFLWLAFGALSVMGLAVVLAAMFGGRSPVTVALDIGLSVTRLILPLVLVLTVQELFSREFDRRYFLISLAYPRSRHAFFGGRFLALIFLIMALLVAMGATLAFLVWLIEESYIQATPVAFGQSYVLVLCFLSLDLLLLSAVACMLAVVASTPSFVLIGTFGFMLVARSYGAIIELLGRQAGLVGDAEGYRAGLGVLAYLLPDLGALDVRMMALYGKPEFLPADWPWLLLGNLAYAVALLALAVWALQRKRFT